MSSINASSQHTEPAFLIGRLPFDGFYGSFLAYGLDQAETLLVEGLVDGDSNPFVNERDYTGLEAGDVYNVLYRLRDHRVSMRHVAQATVPVFAELVYERMGLTLDLTFESLRHPREYNFDTDRLDVRVPLAQAHDILQRVRGTTLEGTIRERCTTRSGFVSFYSNRLADWLAKPLHRWDTNEVGILLEALIATEPDWHSDIADRLSERGVFDTAFDASLDFTAFELALDALLEKTCA